MEIKTKFNIGDTVSMIDWDGKIVSFIIDSIIIKNDNVIYYCDEELFFEVPEEDLFNNIKEKINE